MQTAMKFLRFFIPKKFRSDKMESDRIQIVLALLLAFSLTLVFAFNYWDIGAVNIAARVLESLVISVFSMIVMRISGNIVWSANLMVLSIAYDLILSSLWAGGVHSPAVFWYPVVILAVNFYLSLRWTFLWSTVFFSGYYYLYQIDLMGNLPASDLSSSMLMSFKRDSMLLALATSIWFSLSYRRQRDMQKKQIDDVLSSLEKEHIAVEKKLDENINWIRVLTHDLSNPLQVIGFAAEGLDKNERQKVRIKFALENIANIINHIRNYRAASDGKVKIITEKFVLNEVIEKTIDLFKEKLEQKKITIEIETLQKQYFLTGDKNILGNMILSNIISNAIKFSNIGSKIKIDIGVFQDGIIVCVRDFGIGIPKKILDEIFSFSKSTSRKGTLGEMGTGYGMPLVKEYMKLFDGEIRISSSEKLNGDPDYGTEVKLFFRSVAQKKAA